MSVFRKIVMPWLLVVALLVTAACQPVRPLDTVVESTPSSVEPSPATVDVSGRYEGMLAVAGMELEIFVTLEAVESGFTGSIDIPAQGSVGIPLHDIVFDLEVTPPSIRFQMLEGPGTATFDGQLGDNGEIRGAFLQSGVEGEFVLALAAQDAGATDAALPAGVSSIYTDPAGRFSAPVPTNWLAEEGAGYVRISDPDAAIKMYIVVLDDDDLERATADAWALVDPTFDVAVEQTLDPPSSSGIERTLVTNYDTADRNRVAQAVAQLKDGAAYVILIDGELAALQRRNAQVTIVGSGFKILSVEETDLSTADLLPVNDELIASLEAFIAAYMEAFSVPGAAVGIVEDNELVYTKGFGVADPVTGAPVTPDMHMMIGSTGKSLTTMLMGTLVDDALMTWDTPAQELYPDFRVADPALSETITMRNLVCACTGVPRRDLELLFNAQSLAAQDLVASLGDFEFFTDFGEAFQYSNQMVATAGYIAGEVADPGAADLMAAYSEALQSRVLDPIGMTDTTLSFDAVFERSNYAVPHAQTLEATYVPLDFDVEALLLPIAPAGAHWSTLNDMARYMITQLQEGVAPDGQRVVSAENLKETWNPQIAIANDASYGLGWIVSSYKGQPLISHAGNTFGFTSGFTFLPGRDMGIIVLTNGRATNLFNDGVAGRFLELIFDQPAETAQNLDFYLEQIEQQVAELTAQLATTPDEGAIEPYLDRFTNAALGDIVLSLEEGRLMLDAGEFVTELRPKVDSEGELQGYLQMDPPLQGLLYKFTMMDGGAPTIVLGEGATEYTFVQAE